MHFLKKNSCNKVSGMSLIEVLIVVTIVGLLAVASLVYVTPSLNRGRDGRRKGDMQKISNLLEEYYNDKDSYPTDTLMDGCGGSNPALNPYLREVPCELNTKSPYLYVAHPLNCDNIGTRCSGYRLLTVLSYDQDPDIKRLGCDDDDGCYVGTDGKIYTYGVSKGRNVSD